MPSPLDFKDFKRFTVNNAITSGVYPLSEMTVMWLFYENLHSLFLFSLVASARVVVRIFISPLGGVLGDRFDRGKVYLVLKFMTPFILVALSLSMATDGYIIGILLVYIRAIISELTSLMGSTSLATLLPKDLLPRGIFVNRVLKEISSVSGTILWPFLLKYLGPYVLFISALATILTLPLIWNLKINPRNTNVKVTTGFKLFLSKPEVRGAVLGVAIDQSAISYILNYAPLLVQMEGGGALFYSLANIAFYIGMVVGSFIGSRIKNLGLISVINLALKTSLFLPLLLHNPWAVVYAMLAITLADGNLEILWLMSLRKGAGDQYLSSVMGVDEMVTNIGRLSVLEITPFLLVSGFFPLVSLGSFLIGVEGIVNLLHKEMLENDQT
ncbi:MFS transporter [Metallosphaera tengchongensis]|uniref:MFS transporter n=1 Tax=Metallosphaera tengchongensis TaxID=1532350 RepID=A0A6N0NSJ2_9CREN|nr:MFS transporter [Metallosphaera tengchongensis]QKQ99154.1 MFS transporter [Metallosphaera tengchongensis]